MSKKSGKEKENIVSDKEITKLFLSLNSLHDQINLFQALIKNLACKAFKKIYYVPNLLNVTKSKVKKKVSQLV